MPLCAFSSFDEVINDPDNNNHQPLMISDTKKRSLANCLCIISYFLSLSSVNIRLCFSFISSKQTSYMYPMFVSSYYFCSVIRYSFHNLTHTHTQFFPHHFLTFSLPLDRYLNLSFFYFSLFLSLSVY